MRAMYDFSPLYRSLIGPDHVATLVENALQDRGRDYPPYDIERTADDGYRISLAAAGFAPEELEIAAQPNLLVIRGRKSAPQPSAAYLYQRLALRPFERRFELADHVAVCDARYADGMLIIDLIREIPDEPKPRQIQINAPPTIPQSSGFEPERSAVTA
jgi:molecular chaperone IbpA